MPRNSQSPPSAVDTTSSLSVGCAPSSAEAASGPATIGLTSRVIEGPVPVSAELGAQPSESEEVVSTALGGDWEFRGIRPPIRT